MIALYLLPVVLSLIVLGAHFFRDGNVIMVGMVLVFSGLLGVRRRWAARAVQAALLLGTAEWARTIVQLAISRVQAGQPVLRLVFILGAVALATALSTLAFRAVRVRSWYQPSETRIPMGDQQPDETDARH